MADFNSQTMVENKIKNHGELEKIDWFVLAEEFHGGMSWQFRKEKHSFFRTLP